MRFLDANIFLRVLARDDPAKAAAGEQLFRRLRDGEEEATTSESVIAEVVYVLSSRNTYGMAREAVAALLGPLLALRGLQLASRATYLRALDLYAQYRVDFEDALSVAHMEHDGIRDIVSYDRDFDHIAEVVRVEP